MDQPYKEVRVRIEAPPPELVPMPLRQLEHFPKFYYVLVLLTFLLSGLSLYLSFSA